MHFIHSSGIVESRDRFHCLWIVSKDELEYLIVLLELLDFIFIFRASELFFNDTQTIENDELSLLCEISYV